MKLLKKIKLNHYADELLKEREMNLLHGGNDADKICVCQTNNTANAYANIEFGYTTSGGEGSCYSVIDGNISSTPHKTAWT